MSDLQTNHLRDGGNAYRLSTDDSRVLLSAPINADGTVDESGWTEVEFYCLHESEYAYLRVIAEALSLQMKRVG